jgi:hypothetical protein
MIPAIWPLIYDEAIRGNHILFTELDQKVFENFKLESDQALENIAYAHLRYSYSKELYMGSFIP